MEKKKLIPIKKMDRWLEQVAAWLFVFAIILIAFKKFFPSQYDTYKTKATKLAKGLNPL